MRAPIPPAKLADEKEQLFGLALKALLQPAGPSSWRNWCCPRVALCSLQQVKQTYSAFQTRSSGGGERDCCLGYELAELISSHCHSHSGSLQVVVQSGWAVPGSCWFLHILSLSRHFSTSSKRRQCHGITPESCVSPSLASAKAAWRFS